MLTTSEVRELARLIHDERRAMGLSVDEYYDKVLEPFLELKKLANKPPSLNPMRCKVTTIIGRQCLRGIHRDGMCSHHYMRRDYSVLLPSTERT
jgi:hypothetical protein